MNGLHKGARSDGGGGCRRDAGAPTIGVGDAFLRRGMPAIRPDPRAERFPSGGWRSLRLDAAQALQGCPGLVDPGVGHEGISADVDHAQVAAAGFRTLPAGLVEATKPEPGARRGHPQFGGLAVGAEGLLVSPQEAVSIAHQRRGIGVLAAGRRPPSAGEGPRPLGAPATARRRARGARCRAPRPPPADQPCRPACRPRPPLPDGSAPPAPRPARSTPGHCWAAPARAPVPAPGAPGAWEDAAVSPWRGGRASHCHRSCVAGRRGRGAAR